MNPGITILVMLIAYVLLTYLQCMSTVVALLLPIPFTAIFRFFFIIASTSVFSSIFALGRSLLFTALLWPLGYAGYAVYTCGESSPCLENMSCVRKACPAPANPCVFNVAFSIYLGILFAAAYHLSRATSNYRLYL